MRNGGTSSVDERKQVWLVTSGPNRDKPLADLRVMQAAAFVETSEGRRFLYDFQTFLRKEAMNFRFGHNEIAYVHYYTATAGSPAHYGWGPRLVLKTAQVIENDLGQIMPESWLKPSLLRFDKTEVVELHGQRREKTSSGTFPNPILAFAWTREDAERAKADIILQAARLERNHLLVKWNEQQRIHHPSGIIEISTEGKSDYGFINNRGDLGRWAWGKMSVHVAGREHRFGEWKFFTKPFPIEDTTGMFTQLSVDCEGVHFYYPTGARFDSLSDVDLRLLNVNITFQQ